MEYVGVDKKEVALLRFCKFYELTIKRDGTFHLLKY